MLLQHFFGQKLGKTKVTTLFGDQFLVYMTRCKDAINLSFTPFFTPLVTPNVTPWLAILPTLVSVVNATFVMHETTVYKQIYAI